MLLDRLLDTGKLTDWGEMSGRTVMGDRDRISTLQAFRAAYSGQGPGEVRGCLLGLGLRAARPEVGLAQSQSSGSAVALPAAPCSPKSCLAVVGKEGEVHPTIHLCIGS